jgi:hypothetical protein
MLRGQRHPQLPCNFSARLGEAPLAGKPAHRFRHESPCQTTGKRHADAEYCLPRQPIAQRNAAEDSEATHPPAVANTM